MDIACILLASAAAAFAVLWRLERTWFLARDSGCFCRRRWDGAVETNPDGCPVHYPEAWLRHCEAIFHSDFCRLMEKESSAGEAPSGHGTPAVPGAPGVSAPPARMKRVQRIHRFRPDRRDLDCN
jgi:hypothetical protein